MGWKEFSQMHKTYLIQGIGMHHFILEINLLHALYYYLFNYATSTPTDIKPPLNKIKLCSVFAIHSRDQPNIECMRKEYKYLSWVYGVDRKICHEGH